MSLARLKMGSIWYFEKAICWKDVRFGGRREEK